MDITMLTELMDEDLRKMEHMTDIQCAFLV